MDSYDAQLLGLACGCLIATCQPTGGSTQAKYHAQAALAGIAARSLRPSHTKDVSTCQTISALWQAVGASASQAVEPGQARVHAAQAVQLACHTVLSQPEVPCGALLVWARCWLVLASRDADASSQLESSWEPDDGMLERAAQGDAWAIEALALCLLLWSYQSDSARGSPVASAWRAVTEGVLAAAQTRPNKRTLRSALQWLACPQPCLLLPATMPSLLHSLCEEELQPLASHALGALAGDATACRTVQATLLERWRRILPAIACLFPGLHATPAMGLPTPVVQSSQPKSAVLGAQLQAAAVAWAQAGMHPQLVAMIDAHLPPHPVLQFARVVLTASATAVPTAPAAEWLRLGEAAHAAAVQQQCPAFHFFVLAIVCSSVWLRTQLAAPAAAAALAALARPWPRFAKPCQPHTTPALSDEERWGRMPITTVLLVSQSMRVPPCAWGHAYSRLQSVALCAAAQAAIQADSDLTGLHTVPLISALLVAAQEAGLPALRPLRLQGRDIDAHMQPVLLSHPSRHTRAAFWSSWTAMLSSIACAELGSGGQDSCSWVAGLPLAVLGAAAVPRQGMGSSRACMHLIGNHMSGVRRPSLWTGVLLQAAWMQLHALAGLVESQGASASSAPCFDSSADLVSAWTQCVSQVILCCPAAVLLACSKLIPDIATQVQAQAALFTLTERAVDASAHAYPQPGACSTMLHVQAAADVLVFAVHVMGLTMEAGTLAGSVIAQTVAGPDS